MRKFDVIIIGSGFAGSIMAMILRRLGRTVLVLEKGKHPRFAIGESSTPVADLVLRDLAQSGTAEEAAGQRGQQDGENGHHEKTRSTHK